jgi:hypothetical protein
MYKTKIKNMISPRGNNVANQFKIFVIDKTTFQSYDSVVCDWNGTTLYLYGDVRDYSNTTRKYFKSFLEEETSINYKSRQHFLKEIETNPNIVIIQEVL